MADEVGSTKCCSSCGLFMPLAEFSKDRTKPSGFKKRCKPCHAAQTRDWRDANAAKVNERKREWRIKNLAKVRAKDLAYCARTRDKARARASKWYSENKDRAYLSAVDWKARNKERVRLYSRFHSHIRRTGSGRLSVPAIFELMKKQSHRCAYCRVSIKSKYELDHIMPIALGGANVRENIQLTCSPCNRRKSAKHPAAFARELGLLI